MSFVSPFHHDSHTGSERFARLVACLLVSLATSAVSATQHLVSPGDNWAGLAERLRPGDEVILLPGRHAPASLASLVGESTRPIIIRGFDQANPAIIRAREFGIELIQPRYVVLRDIRIIGAEEVGLRITGRAGDDRKPQSEVWKAQVRLDRLGIEHIGDVGVGVGLDMHGIEGALIQSCRFESWGSTAVDLVGCHDVTIERTVFEGESDLDPDCAVRVRGGSERIWLSNCIIVDGGEVGISIGGSTRFSRFVPAVSEDAEDGSVLEASRVDIDQCLIRGAGTSVLVQGAQRWSMRSTTVLRPSHFVIRFAMAGDDPRHIKVMPGELNANLFVWPGDRLTSVLSVPAQIDVSEMFVGNNLWWAEGLEETEVSGLEMIEPATPQITTLDPLADATGRCHAPEARGYGRYFPEPQKTATVDE